MIDPGHPRLSIVRQCELVSISRSSFYREPTPEGVVIVSDANATHISPNRPLRCVPAPTAVERTSR